MSVLDMKIFQLLHALLVRHEVNLSAIKYHVTHQVVYLTGKYYHNRDGDVFTPIHIQNLENEIRKIQTVRDVTIHFEDWDKKHDTWMRMKSKMIRSSLDTDL